MIQGTQHSWMIWGTQNDWVIQYDWGGGLLFFLLVRSYPPPPAPLSKIKDSKGFTWKIPGSSGMETVHAQFFVSYNPPPSTWRAASFRFSYFQCLHARVSVFFVTRLLCQANGNHWWRVLWWISFHIYAPLAQSYKCMASQHNILTRKNSQISFVLLTGFEPWFFGSLVRHSTNWASPSPQGRILFL